MSKPRRRDWEARLAGASRTSNRHKPASQHPIVLGGFYPLLDRIGVEEAVSRVSNSPHHLLHRILTDLDIALGHLKRTVTSQSLKSPSLSNQNFPQSKQPHDEPLKGKVVAIFLRNFSKAISCAKRQKVNATMVSK
jgi:hypothetical protein